MQEIWTIQKLLNWTIDYFQKRDVPDARLSAELLLSSILNIKRLDLYLQFERILTPEELGHYREFVQRRARHEPVQYILGEQNFMGLNFKINHDVLIPRQETEILVEAVLDEIQRRKSRNLNILDVGTGSGAIAISLAHYCPKCLIIANDNSRKALATAKKNAGSLNTKNVDFILCEATELPGYISEKSDIIVSNPPYVSENHYPALHPQVKNYEPAGALKAGKEGMDFYRSFIPIISLLLKPGGMIFMEIGFDQREKIHFLLKEFRFSHIEFIQDYQKTDRIVKAKL